MNKRKDEDEKQTAVADGSGSDVMKEKRSTQQQTYRYNRRGTERGKGRNHQDRRRIRSSPPTVW
jgi:hypothetical protein